MKRFLNIFLLLVMLLSLACACTGCRMSQAKEIERILQDKYGEKFVVTKVGKNDIFGNTYTAFCYPKNDKELLFTVDYWADDGDFFDKYEYAMFEADVKNEIEKGFPGVSDDLVITGEVSGTLEGYAKSRDMRLFSASNPVVIHFIVGFPEKVANRIEEEEVSNIFHSIYREIGPADLIIDVVVADDSVLGELKKETQENPEIDTTIEEICHKGKVFRIKAEDGIMEVNLSSLGDVGFGS